MQFWLETNNGVRELLPSIRTEEAALDHARALYPDGEDDAMLPEQWMFRREPDDDEDYVLVPGGPAGEEFTWMPRSMWAEGGPLAALDQE